MATHDVRENFAALLAFGGASLAVLDVQERSQARESVHRPGDLLDELELLHARLRCHFACGQDESVVELSRTVVELAARIVELLRQDRDRSGR